MRTSLLLASALLASAIAAPGANAQISLGGNQATLPTPQGTVAGTEPNPSGAGSTAGAGNYGAGNFGPGAIGPGNAGPGALGPGNFGPGAYPGGSGVPAATAATGTERP